ncbi:hypothetical protein AYI68_g1729 [Smittium mucronatum]|uniref:Uncharacterized protein n=1 Tax=Smittium mucronatum TaxID=133383 RepID=A0A1R0H4V9_9FUNG|nr:hypothetical protein AYI68_g1729 [Smittium mucronatum]
MQREMLATISDIINDSYHGFVSDKLVQLIDNSPELLVSILDALGSLKGSEKINVIESIRNGIKSEIISENNLIVPSYKRSEKTILFGKYLLTSICY